MTCRSFVPNLACDQLDELLMVHTVEENSKGMEEKKGSSNIRDRYGVSCDMYHNSLSRVHTPSYAALPWTFRKGHM